MCIRYGGCILLVVLWEIMCKRLQYDLWWTIVFMCVHHVLDNRR